MRAHADAHQGNLADAVVAYDLARGKPLPGLALEHVERLLVLSPINGERKVGVTRCADVLHDHVHVDVGSGNGPEDRIGYAGTVFDPHERNFRLVAVEGDAGDDGLFHGLVLLECNERTGRGARRIVERRQHAKFDLVFAGELDRAQLQNLGPQARHFEHFLEGHALESPRLGNDAWIRGIDAVDIGVDLTLVGFQCGGERDTRGIRAATAQRRDIALGVDALEAGNDHNRPLGKVLAQRRDVDVKNTRLGECAVGQDAHLPAGVALRLQAQFMQGDGEQADRHLLAGRGDYVELARIGTRGELAGEREEAVGFATHRRHHDHKLVPLAMEPGDAPGDVLYPFGAPNRRAAVFLHDQSHVPVPGSWVTACGTRSSRWCRRSRMNWTARHGSASTAPYWGRNRGHSADPGGTGSPS